MTRTTDTDLTLREATAEDIAEIHAIYAEAVRTGTASFELTPPTPEEMTARWQALRAAGYPYLVAEIGGAVAGYAYAGAYRPRPAYRGAVEDSVYVSEAYQGRGLGRALMTELIARCEAAGYRQMVAVVGDSDNQGSIGLHRAMGFADVGVLRSVGWKHGRWLDTVLMQRPLGAGDGTPFEG